MTLSVAWIRKVNKTEELVISNVIVGFAGGERGIAALKYFL